MTCFKCKNTTSPPNARFCIACGYALLQPCPYACGHEALPVRAENSPEKCPLCEKFFTVCPTCGKLHLLGARGCDTSRCAREKSRPVEPFSFHGGDSGGLPMPLRRNWKLERPAQTPLAWEMAPAPHCGGLASRYGLVVWWQEAHLMVWQRPRAGAAWPAAAEPVQFDFFDPPPADGFLPAHRALLLSHGHAYALHAGHAARVSPGETMSQGAAQSLSLRAHSALSPPVASDAALESEGELEFVEMDFETDSATESAPFAAAPFAAAQSWEPHQVEWLAQAATSTWWLAIGQKDEVLIGVRARGADAIFEGEIWALPPQIQLSKWRELLIWHDSPALRMLDTIWHQRDGVWQRAFAPESGASLDGAMPDETGLWLWGRRMLSGHEERLWMRYLDGNGVQADGEITYLLSVGDRIFPAPVVCGSKITFFQTGSRNAILTFDATRPLDDPQGQEIPAALSVVWASEAIHPTSGAQWLLYATDDGTIVSLWQMALAPQALPPIGLMKLRPLRAVSGQNRGASLAFTLGGDGLIVSCTNDKSSWIRAFEWPEGAISVTMPGSNS